MAKLGTTTFDQGANDTEVGLTDHGSAPSPTAGKLYANTTSVYWEDNDLTGGGGETVTKKISKQLANTTGLLDMTESACTAVNLVVTANTTLDGPYFTKHTITGTSQFGGLLIHSDIANTSTTMTDSSITAQTITKGGTVAHRTTRDHPFKYPKFTANTAIFFDGNSDYLTLPDNVDLEFGLNDWTVDFWFYHDTASTLQSLIGKTKTDTALYGGWFVRITAANKMEFGTASATGAFTLNLTGGTTVTTDTWNHVAFTRQGDTVRLFLNGTLELEGVTAATIYNNAHTLYIGVLNVSSSLANYFNGFMDEIRVINGYAAYTSNFSVPTRPHSGHEFPFSVDTKVKYCGQGTNQTSSDVGATVRMGNDSTGSGAAKVSIGDTFNVNSISYSIPLLFENSAGGHNHIHYNIWTEVWGNTELEDADTNPIQFGAVHYGGRAVIGMGYAPAAPGRVNTMDYIPIGTASTDAVDFGDLTRVSTEADSCSNGTRGVFIGGAQPSATNIIDYITIGSTSGGTDFGDLAVASYSFTAMSNGYRGLVTGGYNGTAGSVVPFEYINITTTGNSVEQGGISPSGAQNKSSNSGVSNGSRGVYSLNSPLYSNTLEYVTISSSSAGTNFGDLSQIRYYAAGTDDGSRGVHGAGRAPDPAYVDTIDYMTIGTLGDSTDFGELVTTYSAASAVSNGSRGVFSTFESPTANIDAIEYITIGALGNATDFAGELTQARAGGTACSGD